MSDVGGFCTVCGTHYDSFAGLSKCSTCGDDGVPCSDADQVTVSINWHELRILCIWAERWAHTLDDGKNKDTVYAIAMRLRRQHPERIGLTMADEFGALRAAGYNVEVGGDLSDENIKTESPDG